MHNGGYFRTSCGPAQVAERELAAGPVADRIAELERLTIALAADGYTQISQFWASWSRLHSVTLGSRALPLNGASGRSDRTGRLVNSARDGCWLG